MAGILCQLHAAQFVSRNLAASLAFFTWDILITLDQEIQYIWHAPGSPWGIRAVYLFLRYFSFASLIGTQALAAHFAHIIPVPTRLCRHAFLFQFLAAGLVSVCASIIFMTQVYALYHRQRWVGAAMLALLAFYIVSCGLIIRHLLDHVHYGITCYVALPLQAVLLTGTASLVPPCTTLAFILAKHAAGARAGWGTAPLMVLLTRDCSWGVLGLIGVWIANPLIAACFGIPLAHVGHLWFMSAIPSIGCRVILHMQCLRIAPAPPALADVQLSTLGSALDSFPGEGV